MIELLVDAYHGKFTFPTAAATTVLLWGLIEFREGYTQAGQLDNMLDNARWSLDYLLAAHTAKEEMVAQVRRGPFDILGGGDPPF